MYINNDSTYSELLLINENAYLFQFFNFQRRHVIIWHGFLLYGANVFLELWESVVALVLLLVEHSASFLRHNESPGIGGRSDNV